MPPPQPRHEIYVPSDGSTTEVPSEARASRATTAVPGFAPSAVIDMLPRVARNAGRAQRGPNHHVDDVSLDAGAADRLKTRTDSAPQSRIWT